MESQDAPRRKSPRAPSIALDEAIERALKVYDKERRHAAPIDVVAQDIGYKSANNGAALSALASLRYFGLLDRQEGGKLAITKDVESYHFAPSEELRREILLRWLKSPPLFSELLEKYEGGLPSDGSLRFDLIQKGFSPPAAEEALRVFRRSVDFAHYFDRSSQLGNEPEESGDDTTRPERAPAGGLAGAVARIPAAEEREALPAVAESEPNLDRIPVRLVGGRRAWLLIPSPFFVADKARLKAQIDLLLTEDEENAS